MSGNFERESKESEMFRMNKLMRNAQKRYDKKEDKLKQLEKVFKTTIKVIINDVKKNQAYFTSDDYIQGVVDNLVYEVKIRISNNK